MDTQYIHATAYVKLSSSCDHHIIIISSHHHHIKAAPTATATIPTATVMAAAMKKM
ncbi:MAG: hypothetical protein ACKPKO_01790 [Candidatus Fonsibacter sp.]